MAEYIERELLYDTMNGQDEEFSLIDALDMIDKIPAADVAQVRHGRWKINELYGKTARYQCTACNTEMIDRIDREDRHRYCHNCGAKMDGGRGNGYA